MWALFICRLYSLGKQREAEQICSEQLKPIINDIPDNDQYMRESLIARCAPALYVSHRSTALSTVAGISRTLRQTAINSIAEFVMTKALPMEPYEYHARDGYNISYEESIDLCELVEMAENDSLIYSVAESLGDTYDAPKAKHKFSSQQRSDIVDRLAKLAASKLPDQNNIKHMGYAIAVEAQCARINKAKGDTWEKLSEKARAIPNTADRAYVLTIIASCMPSKYQKKREKLAEESQELIATIPASVDRVDRLYTIASLLSDISIHLAKKSLQIAIDFVQASEEPEMDPLQRRIIDLAYKINPEWAASLASCSDQDPARVFRAQQSKKRLDVLKTKRELLDTSHLQDNRRNSEISRYAEAAWLALGALVAGKRPTHHFQDTRQLVSLAANGSITKTYPLYAYVVENAIRRYSGTPDALKILRPLFEASVIAAEFASRLGVRTITRVNEIVSSAPEVSGMANLLVRPGEREKAILYLCEWIERSVTDYLKICDPYFTLVDLEILRLVLESGVACEVTILCSQNNQIREGIAVPFEQAYRAHWRMHICEQDPPPTDIIVIGAKNSGQFPLHDRWLITKGSGLRLGTSFNSLGLTKDSEISIMRRRELTKNEQCLDSYIRHECKTYRGERLKYSHFTLD